MKNSFKSAIDKAGGTAVLTGLSDAEITVSIQPDGFLGDIREDAGTGAVCRYKFFTPYSETSKKIREGCELVFANKRYIVENITTAYLGSEAVYRKGTLLLETEGEI